MIVIEILNIKGFHPIAWSGKDYDDLEPGQTYITASREGDYVPEQGSIVISAKLIHGSFKDIERLFILAQDVLQSKMISYKKKILGPYEVTMQFDYIFSSGLEYCINQIIPAKGCGIIGLTPSELQSLSSIHEQRRLMYSLSQLLLPQRVKTINELLRVSYLSLPNQEQIKSSKSKSRYLGDPYHKTNDILDNSGKEMLHLATIFTEELDPCPDELQPITSLSFYLKIDDTENGWPEDTGDFKIIPNYNRDTSFNNGTSTGMSLIPLLDLPEYNHPSLDIHQFTEDEITRLEVINNVFISIMLGEFGFYEVNKILGYENSIQDAAAFDAEYIKNNRDYNDNFNEEATRWCLLLQISPYCKWFDFFDTFGDGTIYFMIKKEDLKSRNFSDCQLVVQNT